MDQLATKKGPDEIFRLYLNSTDGSESETLLSCLIQEHAQPVLTGIIRSKLRVSLSNSEGSSENQDALELAGDLRATILNELNNLKNGSNGKSIDSFRGYVAVKAYSACADYFRAMNPQRRRLADMLRHKLNTNPRFGLWKDGNNRWLCGLSSWRGVELNDSESDRLRALLRDPQLIFDKKSTAGNQPTDRLIAIFEWVGGPIEFNQLVTIAADVIDQRPGSNESASTASEDLVNTVPGIDVVVERRLYLERVWGQVTTLPLLQRSALLLNLRDVRGGSAIVFLPHLGIASKAQIAEVLSMSMQQFSQMWHELPLEDSQIASLLGITRQQVINLRKSGRERLARRMKALEGRMGGNK